MDMSLLFSMNIKFISANNSYVPAIIAIIGRNAIHSQVLTPNYLISQVLGVQ